MTTHHHIPSSQSNVVTDSPTESREFVGTFGKPNWFDNVCEEHRNCRNKVCVFDLSSFAKFEVEVSTYYGVRLLEYNDIDTY